MPLCKKDKNKPKYPVHILIRGEGRSLSGDDLNAPSYFLSVRKSYFMLGYNENGNPFAHPISAGIVHAAIRRDPSPVSPVRAAQAWIWGIDENKLPDVLRK